MLCAFCMFCASRMCPALCWAVRAKSAVLSVVLLAAPPAASALCEPQQLAAHQLNLLYV